MGLDSTQTNTAANSDMEKLANELRGYISRMDEQISAENSVAGRQKLIAQKQLGIQTIKNKYLGNEAPRTSQLVPRPPQQQSNQAMEYEIRRVSQEMDRKIATTTSAETRAILIRNKQTAIQAIKDKHQRRAN